MNRAIRILEVVKAEHPCRLPTCSNFVEGTFEFCSDACILAYVKETNTYQLDQLDELREVFIEKVRTLTKRYREEREELLDLHREECKQELEEEMARTKDNAAEAKDQLRAAIANLAAELAAIASRVEECEEALYQLEKKKRAEDRARRALEMFDNEEVKK